MSLIGPFPALILTLAVLVGCANPVPPRAKTDRLNPGKVFTYFGDCDPSCLGENGATVNLYQTPPWLTTAEQVRPYLKAAMGRPTILSIPESIAYGGDCTAVGSYLDNLSANPGLVGVVGFYGVDEPTLPDRPKPISPTELATGNDCIRAHATRLSLPPKLYVIYGCSHSWAGIELFDVLSCDNYGVGDAIKPDLTRLKAFGKPVMLTSGGACPWSHDPRYFVTLINADPQLIGLWGFTYVDNYDASGQCGIRSNPTTRVIFDQLLG